MWKFWDKTLSYKTFAKLLIIMLLSILCASCVINYFADIYGLRSTQGKYAWYLASSKNALYKPRIEAQAPYYMIGTSRTKFIDYVLLSKYLDTHSIGVGMANSNTKEWIFLAEKVKANSKNFLLGFDVFALNKSSVNYNTKRLESTFKNSSFIWFDFADTARFVKYLLIPRPYNLNFTEKDKEQPKSNNYKDIEEELFIRQSRRYKKYLTNYDDILTLAKLADSKDIFIIFPKYAPYYALFQQYDDPNNTIEQQYFQALRLLVKNTKAHVISFYGINEITLEKDNFDDYGWHFKPKIGNLIMARIFDDKSVKLPPNFGVWLDKDNIESYLETMHNDIAANMEILKGL